EPATRQDPSGRIGVIGYMGPVFDSREALSSEDIAAYSSNLEGCFALVRALPGAVQGVTDATRSNNLFWAETESARLVGSRALLVHLVARGLGNRWGNVAPDWDLGAIADLAAIGYFLGDRTPFSGVAALGEGECL